MKSLLLFPALLAIAFSSFGQSLGKALIPKSTYFVFTADFGRISKSMPIKDMNDYDFVQKVVKKVTGSNKETLTLEDIGMDLTGSIHNFSGDEKAFSYTGFSLQLKDPASFLQNDLVPAEFKTALKNEKIAYNQWQLAFLEGDNFMMLDLNWDNYHFEEIADSIFDANHWERPYSWDRTGEMDVMIEELETEINNQQAEEAEDSDYDSTYNDYYERQESMNEKYYRILDSIKDSQIPGITEIFIKSLREGKTLSSVDENFNATQTELADGKIYLNPAKMNNNRGSIDYYTYSPLYSGIDRFAKKTWQSGLMNFTKDGMTIDWNNHGEERLMNVVKAGMKSKYNSDLLAYIPESTQGFALLNINGLGAYEELKKAYMPVLDESENPDYLLASAVWSTIDELADQEAVFDIYGANMFVTYNGLQEMELERTTYDYDEETFEYEERTEKYNDQIPVMTFGIHTEKAYLLKKYMKAWEAYEDFRMENLGDYYRFEKGPIGGTPYFIAIRENIILISNDESLMKNNLAGYGKTAISGDRYKSAKESQLFYANMSMTQFPKDFKSMTASTSERNLFEALKDKTGRVELLVKDVTENKQTIQLNYTFDGKYKNGAYYLMDIMSTIAENTDK